MFSSRSAQRQHHRRPSHIVFSVHHLHSLYLPTLFSVLLLFLTIDPILAYQGYRALIPNGYAHERSDSGITCARLGHFACFLGRNNQFGLDFKAAGNKWTRELCEMDSDGDGLTNGQELGDPCCQWVAPSGTTNSSSSSVQRDIQPFLRMTDLSHPGHEGRTNSAPKCPGDEDSSDRDDDSSESARTTFPPGLSSEETEDGDDGSSCFPATATVRLVDGSVKLMVELHVGDVVQSGIGGSNVFSPVIAFSHREHDIIHSRFVTIVAENGANVTLSSGHYTFAPGLKRARHVRVGDMLPGKAGRVIGIKKGITKVGLFNPHTEAGTIVVNGMVHSCYTETISTGGAHALLAPVRAVFKVLPSGNSGRTWAMSIIEDISSAFRWGFEKTSNFRSY